MNPHVPFLRRCFDLAARAGGRAAPNPLVGAVLVYEGRILAQGFHAAYGERHAEAACLDVVRPEDRHLLPHSTLYVNLEPCAHWGKQPPCADRLVSEEVGRVVVSNRDPFAQVAGRGFATLQAAGIPFEVGLLEAEGRWLNRRFFTAQEQRRPYIILKWAQTADGYLAPASRARTPISGPLAQRLVHRWRTEEAAILVGKTTALHDDPQLTARHWNGPQPLRIVLDRNLELPSHLHLFDGSVETWQVNTQEESLRSSGRRLKVSSPEAMLSELLQALHAAGKQSVLVEGGAAVLQAFIDAGLWDEARVFTAPHALGSGVSAPRLSGASTAFRTAVGADVLSVFTAAASGFVPPAGAGL